MYEIILNNITLIGKIALETSIERELSKISKDWKCNKPTNFTITKYCELKRILRKIKHIPY